MSLQTTVVSKNEQVEELQSKLEKKDEIMKELESTQERKSPVFKITIELENLLCHYRSEVTAAKSD